MSSQGLRKPVFYKHPKQYIAPPACELEKLEVRKKYLLSKTKIKIGKNNILCELESLPASLTPQICQIVGS